MKKVILVGPSASGKDFLMRELRKKNYSYLPKTTTRPIRSGEVEGIEYNFINNELFIKMLENEEFVVRQVFNINGIDWNYGITTENFNNASLFVMTPKEIEQLSKENRELCDIYYLNIPEDIRRKRISERMDNNDTIERRLNSDRIDFMNFTDFDIEISDSSHINRYFDI